MDTNKDGKTPNLSAKEQHEVEKNQPPRAAVLHEIIRTQGDQELERSVAALWWSALAAGLTMGLSLMGMGLLNSRLPDGEGFKVITSFGYCAGFPRGDSRPSATVHRKHPDCCAANHDQTHARATSADCCDCGR